MHSMRSRFILAFPFVLLAGVVLHGQDPVSSTLTITVENVRNSKGVVGVLVFNSQRGWPESVKAAILSKAVPAHPEVTTLVLGDLPVGDYAVVALHDENENMKLDKNFIGVPREGWGMSKNPKARLSAPSFRQARFSLQQDSHLRIHLNY